MKRRWIRVTVIFFSSVILLGIVGWMYLSWLMKQPLYALGDVAAQRRLTASLAPPEQKDPAIWSVETGIDLTYSAFGEGKPVLVVHGGPGIPYPDCWKGLQPLQKDYRFYFYHQRGCGDSSRPIDRLDGNFYDNMTRLETTLGIGAQVADIERIRRILGEEKLTLVGHSFGGFIATMYAAEFPDRVEKLVLVAPAGVLTPPDQERNLFELARVRMDPDQRESFDDVMERYFDFASIFSKSDQELADLHNECGRYLLGVMGGDPYPGIDSPPSGGWAVFAVYFSLGQLPDYTNALPLITAPTLILVGEDDEVAMAGSRSYQPIPGSIFKLISSEEPDTIAGHFVFEECPSAFARVLTQFLVPAKNENKPNVESSIDVD